MYAAAESNRSKRIIIITNMARIKSPSVCGLFEYRRRPPSHNRLPYKELGQYSKNIRKNRITVDSNSLIYSVIKVTRSVMETHPEWIQIYTVYKSRMNILIFILVTAVIKIQVFTWIHNEFWSIMYTYTSRYPTCNLFRSYVWYVCLTT